MKYLVSILVLSISISTFAFHPTDLDSLSKVGQGSSLTVLQDINFLPNNREVIFSLKETNNDMETTTEYYCSIKVRETQPYDRVLRAGTVINVIKGELVYESNKTYITAADLKFDHPSISNMRCDRTKSNSYNRDITIGDFKKLMGKILQLKIAPPQEM